jgi:hypothetical protein
MTVIKSSKIGPLKKFDIAKGDLQRYSDLRSSTVTLPTSEPATAQISYTIQASDLCTISPSVPMKNFAVIHVHGKGGTAGSLSYRTIKNTVSQATASLAYSANFYLNCTFHNIGEVQIGDVIEIKLWSNQSDAYIDFHGTYCTPAQPQCFKPNVLIKDLTWSMGGFSTSAGSVPFSNAGFTLTASNTLNGIFYPLSNATFLSANCASNTGFQYLVPNTTYGAFRGGQGDANFTVYSSFTAATFNNWQSLNYPISISFREVSL